MANNFYQDVIKTSSKYTSASPCRDLDLLEPVFRAEVISIVADAKNQGFDLRAVETYRSQALQQHYFDVGTTQLRAVGVHHFGLACDLVVFVNNQPRWDVSYAFLGPLAKKYGLVWGGDWTSKDMVHVQRVLVVDQTKLFNESWYPDNNYSAVLGIKPPTALTPHGLIEYTPAPIIVKPSAGADVVKVITIPAPQPNLDVKAAASAKLTGVQKIAFDIAVSLNTKDFQNWFYLANIMAFIDTESDFDFKAFRQEPSGVASYGCMQVLDVTAAGLGFKGDPEEMYDPQVGIHMGMMACCQNWNVLAKRLGHDPSIKQWVMAYNEGAGAVLQGKTVENYWNVWSKNKAKWVGVIGDI